MKKTLKLIWWYVAHRPEVMLVWVASVAIGASLFLKGDAKHMLSNYGLALMLVALVVGVVNFARWRRKQREGAKQLAFFEQQINKVMGEIEEAAMRGDGEEINRLGARLEATAARFNREAEEYELPARIRVTSRRVNNPPQ